MRFITLSLILSGLLMTTTSTRAADEPAKVLKHVVMYKFNDNLTPAQVEEVVDAFGKMTKQIDAVIGYEHGTNVSQEMKSEGFTHIFVVTFKDEAGRETYLKHAAHDTYVALARERREKVIVLDYWTAK
jgi:electron transfer flavoprotein alpha subunit